jgi:hypothetical protein
MTRQEQRLRRELEVTREHLIKVLKLARRYGIYPQLNKAFIQIENAYVWFSQEHNSSKEKRAMSIQQIVLDGINSYIESKIGNAGQDLVFADPTLAPQFGNPAFFYWGQATDELTAVLNGIPGLTFSSVPSDVTTLSVWTANGLVIVLEPEGA